MCSDKQAIASAQRVYVVPRLIERDSSGAAPASDAPNRSKLVASGRSA
jgi:hypothetical protein